VHEETKYFPRHLIFHGGNFHLKMIYLDISSLKVGWLDKKKSKRSKNRRLR
jgi:hypothetical protein